MTIFGNFMKRVRLKSIKLGPVTWEIVETDGSLLKEKEQKNISEPEKIQNVITEDTKKLDRLIYSLENFHSNPEGIHYIGQTLVEIDSFLFNNGISGEPAELALFLMEEIDTDERKEAGIFDPILSVGKINKLKRSLQKISADIFRFEANNDEK